MDKQRLWLRVTKDFTKEEHMMLLEIMAEQYGLPEDLMNTNVLEIIASRNDADFVLADNTDSTTNWFWRDHSAGSPPQSV